MTIRASFFIINKKRVKTTKNCKYSLTVLSEKTQMLSSFNYSCNYDNKRYTLGQGRRRRGVGEQAPLLPFLKEARGSEVPFLNYFYSYLSYCISA